MCTVSVILHPQLPARASNMSSRRDSAQVLRIVCNRDEKRVRTEALPPICREFGERTAILPIDPLSRGTWIGVNDAGLALCLLNATVRDSHTTTARGRKGLLKSRGEIIPSLLNCETVDEAIGRVARLDSREFPPFRLISASRTHIGMVASARDSVSVQQLQPLRAPFMATSSSLGDELVAPIRRELFGECLRSCPDTLEAQRRFHSHQWPDRKNLSVLMSRPDARTVSRTIVEVGSEFVRMTYCALSEVQAPSIAAESKALELVPTEAIA
ncbi:MAG: NRDE family protein [Phycisphaerales bacterium]